jgi:hypothetical protein
MPLADIVDGEWQSFEFQHLKSRPGNALHFRLECPSVSSGMGVFVAGEEPEAPMSSSAGEEPEAPILSSSGDEPEDPMSSGWNEESGVAIASGSVETGFRPDLRVYSVSNADGVGVAARRSSPATAIGWLEARERALAEMALARSDLERHGVGSAARAWLKFSRPFPPVQCRPWKRATPLWRKLVRALRLYGPATVMSELLLRARSPGPTRPGERADPAERVT